MAAKMTSEIFGVANNLKSDEERVAYLQQNRTKAVMELLRCNFNKDIKFLLPEGRPDVSLSEEEEGEFKPQNSYFPNQGPIDDGATLNYEVRRLYLFVEGGNPHLTDVKRETLWIELVNSLHPSEADDLWHMKDGKLSDKYKKITHRVAYNSFPECVQQPSPQPKRDSKGRFIKTEKSETKSKPATTRKKKAKSK